MNGLFRVRRRLLAGLLIVAAAFLAASIYQNRPDTDAQIDQFAMNDAGVREPGDHFGRTDASRVTQLIKNGTDPNGVVPGSDPPMTFLQQAVQGQDFELAKLLLEHGARADCHDRFGKTPLHWAAFYGNLDMIELLLAHGAKPNAIDYLGRDALQLAQKVGQAKAVDLLHRKGAKLPGPVTIPRNKLGQLIVRLPLSTLPGIPSKGRITYSAEDKYTSSALSVKRNGRLIAQPATLETLFTDRTLWPAAALRYNTDRLQVCIEEREAYRFFGLVSTRRHWYLGVVWCDGCESAHQKRVEHVFELVVRGHTLEMTLLRTTFPIYDAGRFVDGEPVLTKSYTGDLIVRDGEGTFRYLPAGKWKKVGPPVKPVD